MRSLTLLLFTLLFYACGQEKTAPVVTETAPPKVQNETAQMAAELKRIYDTADPRAAYNLNSRSAEMYRKASTTGDIQNQITNFVQFCYQLLLAGKTEECITNLKAFFKQNNYTYDNLLASNNLQLVEIIGIAYLRLGEQENCQNNHTEYSCILPLNDKAIHTLKNGSTEAIKIFEKIYAKHPTDKYKWLINLAHMTLGQHPHKVPKDQLIPFPNWDLESKSFPRFKEIAQSLGLAINGLSGGVCLDDFDNNGYIDIFATSYAMMDNAQLFLNDGKKFTNATASSGLNGIVSGLNSIHADYDNDGDKDILILRGGWLNMGGHHPNSLLRNNGDGTFTDVTRSSGIYSLHPTQTAAWADVNKDGFLDLFIGNESLNTNIHSCELYINQKNGTFKEMSVDYGLGKINAMVKAVSFGDINNDQWADLYISVCGGKNKLFRNDQGKFVDISVSAKVELPIGSFPCWFWDVNNDGYEDIFVSGYDDKSLTDIAGDYAKELAGKKVTTDKPKLYINNGDNTFSDKTVEYHLDKTMYTMGCNFGDLDNDGWLDFYVGTGAPDYTTIVPNRMFRNVNGKDFEEVTSIGGFGHIQKGHGVGFADFDQDGDQDIYAVMGGAFEGDQFTNVYFENPISKNDWIILELEGSTSNRDGIGSKIVIELKNGKKIFYSVNTGGSFGASTLQAEIGIPKGVGIKAVTINWVNGEKQSLRGLDVNKRYKVKEGTRAAIEQAYKPLKFEKASGGHHHHH